MTYIGPTVVGSRCIVTPLTTSSPNKNMVVTTRYSPSSLSSSHSTGYNSSYNSTYTPLRRYYTVDHSQLPYSTTSSTYGSSYRNSSVSRSRPLPSGPGPLDSSNRPLDLDKLKLRNRYENSINSHNSLSDDGRKFPLKATRENNYASSSLSYTRPYREGINDTLGFPTTANSNKYSHYTPSLRRSGSYSNLSSDLEKLHVSDSSTVSRRRSSVASKPTEGDRKPPYSKNSVDLFRRTGSTLDNLSLTNQSSLAHGVGRHTSARNDYKESSRPWATGRSSTESDINDAIRSSVNLKAKRDSISVHDSSRKLSGGYRAASPSPSTRPFTR